MRYLLCVLSVLAIQSSLAAFVTRSLSDITFNNATVVSTVQDDTVPTITALTGPATYDVDNELAFEVQLNVASGSVGQGSAIVVLTAPSGRQYTIDMADWTYFGEPIPLEDGGEWLVTSVALHSKNGRTNTYSRAQLQEISGAWLSVTVTEWTFPTLTSLTFGTYNLECGEDGCNGPLNYSFTASGPADHLAFYLTSAATPGVIYSSESENCGASVEWCTTYFYVVFGNILNGVWVERVDDMASEAALHREMQIAWVEIRTNVGGYNLAKRVPQATWSQFISPVFVTGAPDTLGTVVPTCSSGTFNAATYTTPATTSFTLAIVCSADTGGLAATIGFVTFGNGDVVYRVDDDSSLGFTNKLPIAVNTTVTLAALIAFDYRGNGVIYGSVPASAENVYSYFGGLNSATTSDATPVFLSAPAVLVVCLLAHLIH